jgi:hypothetical protein
MESFLYSQQVSNYFSNTDGENNKTKDSILENRNQMTKHINKEMLKVLSAQIYVSCVMDI